MDKQKQIEELTIRIVRIAGKGDVVDRAEALYDEDCRVIPENAVVLTREEYEKLKLFEERVRSGVCFTQKEWFDYCQKDSNERTSLLIKAKKDTRKETAEKFAEMVNQVINAYRKKVGEDECVVDARRLIFEVNEICKEFTRREK